jgi:hypothetical protein
MRSESVVAAILASVGLALCAWAGSEARDAQRAADWPAAPAVIEESQGSSNKPAIDSFHLSYRYEVAGVRHVGHKFAFGDDQLEGTQRAKQYRVGDTVPAYYDPADPDRSILVRGIGFTTYLKVAMALALFAVAAGQLRAARK